MQRLGKMYGSVTRRAWEIARAAKRTRLTKGDMRMAMAEARLPEKKPATKR
jgi:histone H3/H4